MGCDVVTDPSFVDALREALTAGLKYGVPLWSSSDGHSCYVADEADGCTLTVIGVEARLVSRVVGVDLAALT